MDTYIVEANKLVKRFNGFVAVDGVDFSVSSGELLGLLGPNGAGKTSIIRMLYGISPVTAGELRVFGKDIAAEWRAIRARLGVCQQDDTLDPDLTVEQNLTIYARYFDMERKRARERCQQMLSFFALTGKRGSQVKELSGGLSRRLQLARALMAEPDLLILDEPTTGLDPQSRHQLWDRLLELRRRGVTQVLTTHYMEEAASLCERLLIMDHGKIIAEGGPADLIERYASPNVIELAGPGADLRGFLTERGVEHDDLGSRIVIYDREDRELQRAVRERFCTETCTFRSGNLEDVFLRLTGRELRE